MKSSDRSGKTTLLHLLPPDDVTGNVNRPSILCLYGGSTAGYTAACTFLKELVVL